jgi:hypothetical protein
MNEKSFHLSAYQLLCLLFFYLLSGMMLFCGGALFSALFASFFTACLCFVANALSRGRFSSASLYGALFGRLGMPMRLVCALIAFLSLLRAIFAVSAEIYAFHGAENALVPAPFLLFLCIFAVRNGFVRAARFSELCVFALALACPLALFGGGEGVHLSFAKAELFSAFDVIGAPAVILSAYLRCVTPESGKMSPFAKNSTFHLPPLAAGVFASVAAPTVYSFFCFAGQNVLFSLLSWFLFLSRLFLISIGISDLISYPEKCNRTVTSCNMGYYSTR